MADQTTLEERAMELLLRLTPMERDMLVAICDEGIEDWNDQTAVGLRAKVLATEARTGVAINATPFAWHGDGDLCLGPECNVVDADGDHPMRDTELNPMWLTIRLEDLDAAVDAVLRPITGGSDISAEGIWTALRRLGAGSTDEVRRDSGAPDGWRWACAGCHRPVVAMGMCETCGVFGVMEVERRVKDDPHVPQWEERRGR